MMPEAVAYEARPESIGKGLRSIATSLKEPQTELNQ